MGSDNTQSVDSFESSITTGNALVNNSSTHSARSRTGTTAFSLSQDSYYPLIVYFGENGGGDQITVRYTAPGATETDDGDGIYFSRQSTTGLDVDTANATDSSSDAYITPSTIQAALGSSNVSLDATRDIKVQSSISLSENSNTFTLDSGNTIVIDQKSFYWVESCLVVCAIFSMLCDLMLFLLITPTSSIPFGLCDLSSFYR